MRSSKKPAGRHRPSFRADVALAAVRGDKTPAEVAEQFGVRLDDVLEWRDRVGADRHWSDDQPAPIGEADWVFALEASETGVWQLDILNGGAWRSLQHDQIFGYPELLPYWDYDLFMQHVVETDRERVDAAFRRTLNERGDWVFECRIHRADGEQRWIAAKGRVFRDDHDRPNRMWGTVRDVTQERRAAEEALSRSEERYRALFNSMDAGFCVIERVDGEPLDFRYVEANPAFVKSCGIAEVVGKTIRQIAPGVREEWLETYDEVLRSGLPVRVERELLAQQRVVEMHAYRVEDQSQRRVAVIFTDFTGRKQIEAAQRKADQAKDEFLAVLGHELRNPLAPLRTGLDLLAHVARKPQILERVRPMMERQLSHLVRLVNDLLDMSRIRQGKIDLQHAPLDLNRPIEVAVEQMRPLIEAREHELRLRLSEAGLPVHGDLERLTQVVSNLLSNAAKYMDPGGTILLSSAVEHGQAVLRVRDAGFGIPADGFDKLFRMFGQIAEHQAKTGGGGLGIGLALSRQLIELHGGTIEVESEGLERGSEFIVRLPMTSSGTGVGDHELATRAPVQPRRVLIVDDNADVAEALRMLLDLNGHLVHAVQDGETALEEMEGFQPDIVLLDLGLPGMDGIEVARRIRAMPGGDEVRLIAVTGWGQEEDRRRTAEAGFDDHLIKPVGVQEVLRMLVSGRRGSLRKEKKA